MIFNPTHRFRIPLIGIGTLLLYIVILFGLHHHADTLRKKIELRENLLATLNHIDASIHTAQEIDTDETPPISLESLQSIITDSKFSKKITVIELANNSLLHVHFNQVTFDPWIQWLIDLWQTHHFVIKAMSVTQKGAPGMVEVDLSIMSS